MCPKTPTTPTPENNKDTNKKKISIDKISNKKTIINTNNHSLEKTFKKLKLVKKIHQITDQKSKKKHGLIFWTFISGLSLCGLIILIGIITFITLYQTALYNLDELRQAQSTIIMDREGSEIYLIHAGENRKKTSIKDMPKSLTNAIIAIEDDDFYNHIGIDVQAIGKAVLSEFFGIGPKRGGSTITQQLSRNLFLSREYSYKRKLYEIISALKIEQNYTKDQILETYLNTVPFGNNAYGAQSAANLYFGKKLKNISLAESAILAALPNAPSHYSPYGQNKHSHLDVDSENLKNRKITSESDIKPNEYTRGLLGKLVLVGEEKRIYIRGRVDLILRRMLDLKLITKEEKDDAWTETQNIEFKTYREKIKYPHFVMYVKQTIEKKYGKELIEQGGLRVYTTIDPKLQEIAEKTVVKQGEINESTYGTNNASLISIDTNSGQVLAMVGSRDYFDTEHDGNVNVALRYRLPGSSFKPFAYAGAFMKGYAPSTITYDLPTDFGGGYKPKNYDGTFKGPISFRKSLGSSLNIPAVKAGYLAGIPDLIKLVNRMGIHLTQDESFYGLSLSLGAGEVRLLDLVNAYAVFARNGIYKPPVIILKIEDRYGNILEEWTPTKGEQVLDPQIAYLITDILSDQDARGSGWNKYLQVDDQIIASKTGTSNKKIKNQTVPSDAWTIGYTKNIVTGVWAGNNDGTPLRYNAAGLIVAGPIWHDYMQEALKDQPITPFDIPDNIKHVMISTLTGLLPSSSTPSSNIKKEIFTSFNIPTETDKSLVEVEVDAVTGLLASEECPEEARETRVFREYHSLQPDLPNWEKPVQVWARNNAEFTGAPPSEKCSIKEGDPRTFKPEINIISPVNSGKIGSPSTGVWTSVKTVHKLKQVEFYFDGILADTEYEYPYKGTILIPKSLPLGETHTISVIAIDEYHNRVSDTIQVIIGEDNDKPEISIIYPKPNQEFSIGSSITIKINVVDQQGDIDYITYYWNDKLYARKLKYPYSLQLTVPENETIIKIKAIAFDKSGNQSADTISLKTKIKQENSDYTLDLLSPSNGSHFNEGSVVPIKIYLSPDLLKNMKRIEIIGRSNRKILILGQISNFSTNKNGIFEIILENIQSGEYMVQAKGIDKNNKIIFSPMHKIIMEGEAIKPTPIPKSEEDSSNNPPPLESGSTI